MIHRTFFTESCVLQDLTDSRSPGRIAMAAVLGLCVLGAAGWLAIRATPAAQRVTEQIKPYDPLQ